MNFIYIKLIEGKRMIENPFWPVQYRKCVPAIFPTNQV